MASILREFESVFFFDLAVSAFRSTSRRGCQIGCSTGSGEPSSTLTRSKRDPSRARGGHHHLRRSSSTTDFSPKTYLSDCSSSSSSRYDRRRYTTATASSISHRSRGSVCLSDSESDMESVSLPQRHRGRNADSEDEIPPFLGNSANHGLKRTMSTLDLSQQTSSVRCGSLIPYNDIRDNNMEDFVEEKTIQDAYAEMKSLQTDPPAGDHGTTDLLDAMRSEVQRAVAEVRMELDKSIQKNRKSAGIFDEDEERLQEAQGTDAIQAVADIQKEYSAKLEQSEIRVRELWSLLAVEERRCFELAKIVKELLPTQSEPLIVNIAATPRRWHKRRNSAEKQAAMSLDDEALKYFEECVSISTVDDDVCRNIGQHSSSRKDGALEQICSGEDPVENVVVASKGRPATSQGDSQANGGSVGSDGVVLPWLQWEAEPGGSDKSPKVAKRHLSHKSSSSSSGIYLNRANNGSNNPFYSNNGHAKLNTTRRPTPSSQGGIDVGHTLLNKAACGSGSDNLVPVLQATISAKSLVFTVDDTMSPKDCKYWDTDSLMLERIRFRCRVESGELVLCCHGLFL